MAPIPLRVVTLRWPALDLQQAEKRRMGKDHERDEDVSFEGLITVREMTSILINSKHLILSRVQVCQCTLFLVLLGSAVWHRLLRYVLTRLMCLTGGLHPERGRSDGRHAGLLEVRPHRC